jgi:hypothetical protein
MQRSEQEKIMSTLIDKFLNEVNTPITEQAKDLRWYIAKPIPFKSISELYKRVKDGIRVVRGKSFVVHYKRDE